VLLVIGSSLNRYTAARCSRRRITAPRATALLLLAPAFSFTRRALDGLLGAAGVATWRRDGQRPLRASCEAIQGSRSGVSFSTRTCGCQAITSGSSDPVAIVHGRQDWNRRLARQPDVCRSGRWRRAHGRW
jgi:hypothetical protein